MGTRECWRDAALTACGAAALIATVVCVAPVTAAAQPWIARTMDDTSGRHGGRPPFASAADSTDWHAARALAERASGYRIAISLFERRLWAIVHDDTVFTAPVAVASGTTFRYQGRQWSFTTPRGRHTVRAKDSLPAWIPPDWHYYEVARLRGLVVRRLTVGAPVSLADGRWLEARSRIVGLVGEDSVFIPLPPGDEIIFDGFIFIPPSGSLNRRVAGPLGAYRLDLGGGILLHGTPDEESIGAASTHGCIRLGDADIAWLYEIVPVGTPVYIY